MTDLNELMSSSFVRIKLVAFVHFVFISNGMLGAWGHGAYFFYNFLFMISLLWTMHSKDSVDAIQTALVIDACSIILDLISIIVYFNYMNGWAVAFTIINLVVRPVSIILLYREYTHRGGTIQTAVFPTSQQRSYQDIDRPVQPVPSNSTQTGPNVASIF